MDQKHDPPKRAWYPEDSDFNCPDCQSLEEHGRKNCPKRSSAQINDSSQMMTMDTDDENCPKKKTCYRCDDCNSSFTSSYDLDNHMDGNCAQKQIMLTGEVASYKLCMDRLKSAMENEISSFDLFQLARSEAKDAVVHYAAVKTQKERDHKAYVKADARKKELCTIVSAEEQLIMSDIVAKSFCKFKDSLKEEEHAAMAVHQALLKLRRANQASTSTASEVQFAFSEVFKAFKEQAMPTTSCPEVLNQELMQIRTNLEQNFNILIELQQGAAELEASISVMLGVDSKEGEFGVENAGLNANQENESSEKSKIGTSQEKVLFDNAQFDQMDMTLENMDSRPSTSGTY